MPRTGRPKALLELSSEERDQLERWARRRKSSQALALRSRIVLGCAEGLPNKEVAAREGVAQQTVGKWRARFLELRLDGLGDDPRPGRVPSVTADQVEKIVVDTLESTPENATHWSRTSMAKKSGLSPSTIGRIWRAFELKPHRTDGFKPVQRPDVRGEGLRRCRAVPEPPRKLRSRSASTRNRRSKPLARSQPAFPMMPGMPEKRTHDYVRHGTTSLFAAFNTADGTVISSLHRRHRTIEFRKFLIKIDSEVPADLDIHLVCDNYGTHKTPAIRKWLAAHPRFHMHFTPTYSSWINQVERWFAYITDQLIRRGDHRSVQALEADIRAWVKAWNDDPKPFIWIKTAEQILTSIGRLMQRVTGAGH